MIVGLEQLVIPTTGTAHVHEITLAGGKGPPAAGAAGVSDGNTVGTPSNAVVLTTATRKIAQFIALPEVRRGPPY